MSLADELLLGFGVLINDGLEECELGLGLPMAGGELHTFIWDGSDSQGTSPPDLCETLDSALRRSSRVVWKVSSDMLMVLRLYYIVGLDCLGFEGVGVSDEFRREREPSEVLANQLRIFMHDIRSEPHE